MRKGQSESMNVKPFYAASHKTSSEIINEARAVIQKANMDENINSMTGGSGAPRPLATQRPFTPRERQRTLFGKVGRNSRPPSAVNLKYLQQQNSENLKNVPNTSKKGQLCPMTVSLNSSIDDKLFNQLLENIDEKPELSGHRKKIDDVHKLKHSSGLEIDHDNENQLNGGSKLKLPSLNGLAKPLHHRKGYNQRSSTIAVNMQSSFEEKDEVTIFSQNAFSPLAPCKSSEYKPNNASKIKMDESEHFPNIQNCGSLEIFNKKRLYSNFKSKSDDTKFNPATQFENFSKTKDEQSDGTSKKNNYDLFNVPSKLNSVKIAVQIPSPELITSFNNHNVSNQNSFKRSVEAPPRLQNVYNILDNLSNKEAKTLTDDDIVEMLLMLYDTLDQEGSWQSIGGDEKAVILKVLYNYVENTNESLLIAIARIILALRVTGSNLSGVCKLVFKVARNDKNDYLFVNDNLLELFMVGLGRAEPLHDAECLVYGYGALKFLGMNPILLERMRPLGVLPLMTLHLKMFNEARADDVRAVGEQGCHGLYQLTGALRNMAGSDGSWNVGHSLMTEKSTDNSLSNNLSDFISGGTLTELCRTIYLFSEDLDIEINASRTLSVLSADFECCVVLCEQKNIIPAIIKLLKLYTDRAPLIVRLTYILGNMVACNNDIRTELYDENGAMDVLLKVLNLYLKRCWPVGKIDSAENIIIGSDLDGSNGSDEDVMVKCVRIIANMCMNPTVGSRLAETNEIGDQTLSWILKCLRQHSPSDSVELIASTLAALNNLSYYHTGEDISSTAFGGLQIHLCEALCRFLSQDISSCVIEAARVLGNMSRSKVTRDFIVDTGALTDITRLTKNDDQEVSLAAAGILVNMAADENARQVWIETGGIREVAQALHIAAAHHHWLLAHLLCQALWNATPLPNSDISLLAPLLLDVLDEQQVFGTTNLKDLPFIDIQNIDGKLSANDSYLLNRLTWEEFATVAVNLLDKIDPNLDSPSPLDSPEIMFITNGHASSDLIPI